MRGLRLLWVAVLGMAAGMAQSSPPEIAFDSNPDFFKLPSDMNFGEVLGIAINSKGQFVVLNHPGTYGGPVFGAASTQLLLFDENGKYLHEIGRGVYGLGYAHSVRFDKYDNLWVVDKATNSVMRFNPSFRVTMNLGRREEGPDEHHYIEFARGDAPPQHVDGEFRGSTDVAWDSADNIYVSDGYFNSRVAKFDKHGYWIKSWGSRGNQPGQFNPALDHLHHQWANPIPVHFRPGARPHLQTVARWQDPGDVRRVRPRGGTVQLGSRPGLSFREPAVRRRHEQLARAEGDVAFGTEDHFGWSRGDQMMAQLLRRFEPIFLRRAWFEFCRQRRSGPQGRRSTSFMLARRD